MSGLDLDPYHRRENVMATVELLRNNADKRQAVLEVLAPYLTMTTISIRGEAQCVVGVDAYGLMKVARLYSVRTDNLAISEEFAIMSEAVGEIVGFSYIY